MDMKMEMMCDPAVWQDVLLRRCKERKDDMEAVFAVSDSAGRAFLVSAIADGRYWLSPPKTLYVDKLTGLKLSYKEAERRGFKEVRTLYAPGCSLDAIVLAVVSRIYNSIYGSRIHPACVSYQRGIGVGKILKEKVLPRLKAGEKGYKIDISKYFDSVDRKTLDEVLQSMDSGSPLDGLLWKHFHDDRVIVNGLPEERYMSIRQGNAMGTLLANLVLRDVDQKISEMDVFYIRYADDILMIGPDADRALVTLTSMIASKGLTLNPKKVERVETGRPFDFLGCEIDGGRIDVSKKSYERVKREIRLVCRPHKWVKKESRAEQKKAIRKIDRILFGGDRGWAPYFFSVVTGPDGRIRELDRYIRDHLKGVYVGRQTRHRYAKEMTSDWQLKELGYRSLVNLCNAYRCGKNVYETVARN